LGDTDRSGLRRKSIDWFAHTSALYRRAGFFVMVLSQQLGELETSGQLAHPTSLVPSTCGQGVVSHRLMAGCVGQPSGPRATGGLVQGSSMSRPVPDRTWASALTHMGSITRHSLTDTVMGWVCSWRPLAPTFDASGGACSALAWTTGEGNLRGDCFERHQRPLEGCRCPGF
jgi:hypothetical protein